MLCRSAPTPLINRNSPPRFEVFLGNRASRHCWRSESPERQPVTVPRRLDELEKRLGRRLVLREPTGYKLTKLGQNMVTYAEGVEEATQSFERSLAAFDFRQIADQDNSH